MKANDSQNKVDPFTNTQTGDYCQLKLTSKLGPKQFKYYRKSLDQAARKILAKRSLHGIL
jgi:hypothetical protein